MLLSVLLGSVFFFLLISGVLAVALVVVLCILLVLVILSFLLMLGVLITHCCCQPEVDGECAKVYQDDAANDEGYPKCGLFLPQI